MRDSHYLRSHIRAANKGVVVADYAEPLKRAWEGTDCHPICRAWDGDGAYCKGHAALLEMVDGHHFPNCKCNCVDALFIQCDDAWCIDERRRLRAAVGVDIES